MDPNRCYIYVQGWRANATLQDRAQVAADPALMRECVIVAAPAQWPNHVPPPPATGCATIICGCEGHPHRFVDGTANDFRIRRTFLRVEGEC